MAVSKLARRAKIKKRIRKIVTGTSERPRLTVFRSNKNIYVQLVDDATGATIVASSYKGEGSVSKIEQAKFVGKDIAEKATSKGIKAISFDRNGYLYHGRVKALADAAREGGLNF